MIVSIVIIIIIIINIIIIKTGKRTGGVYESTLWNVPKFTSNTIKTYLQSSEALFTY